MIGADYSSKFSPWIANGCISVRQLYYDILSFEEKVAKNKSTEHFYFHLRVRDFFRFYCVAYQKKIFWQSGIKEENSIGFAWGSDSELINRWKTG